MEGDSEAAAALLAAAADAVAAAGDEASATAVAGPSRSPQGSSAGGAPAAAAADSTQPEQLRQPSGRSTPPRSPRQALLAAFNRQPRLGLSGARQAAAAAAGVLQRAAGAAAGAAAGTAVGSAATAAAAAALHRAAGTAVGGLAAAQLAGAVQNLGAATKLGAEAAATLVGRSAGAAAQLAGTAATLAAGAAGAAGGAAATAAGLAIRAATAAAGEGGAAAAALLGALGGAAPDMPGARGLLSEAEIERAVVGVARDALYSAASLDDPAVADAAACLELLPGSAVARRELDAIAALRRLPEFGVTLLPAQLRDTTDRRELLRAIMAGRVGASAASAAGGADDSSAPGSLAGAVPPPSVKPWRRLSDVLEIAELLGLGGRDTELEARLLAAEAALAAGEAGAAEHLALQLASARHAPAWRLAAALAAPLAPLEDDDSGGDGDTNGAAAGDQQRLPRPRPAIGEGSRQSLLAFALCHCPQALLAPLTDELLESQARLGRTKARGGGRLSKSSAAAAPGGGDQQQQQQDQQQQLTVRLASDAAPQRAELLELAGAAAAGGGRSALDGAPTLGEAPLLLAALLSGAGGEGGAADVDARLEAALAAATAASAPAATASASMDGEPPGAPFCVLQRVLAVGSAAQLLLASAAHAADVAPPQQQPADQQGSLTTAARRRLLELPSADLAAAVERLRGSGALTDAEAAAAAAAARCAERARRAADGRRLRGALPAVEPGRFLAGDAAYRREVCAQLARSAGERAAAVGGGEAGEAATAAEAELAEARQLAEAYGADAWPLAAAFLDGYLAARAAAGLPPERGGGGGAGAVEARLRELLARPGAAAAHLYRATLPAVPPAATPHLVFVLGLIGEALRAAASPAAAAGASVTAGGAAEGEGGADVAVDAPAAAASLAPLERLRDLLEKSARALAGLAAKDVVAAHVAALVEPCLPPLPPEEGGADGAKEAAAAAAGPVPSLDPAAFAARGAGAVADFVWRTGPPGAAHAAKLLRHLAVIADMLEGPAPARHAALRKALSQLGGPGLPYLALTLGALTAPASGSEPVAAGSGSGGGGVGGGEQQQEEEEERKREHERRRAEDGRRASVAHLPLLAPAQLAALGSFVAGAGAQPLPAAAVGPLRPLAMRDATRLLLLADTASLLTDAKAPPPSAALAAAAGPLAPPEALAAGWLPPAMRPDLQPRQRALLSLLLRVARRCAARVACAAAARDAGLPDAEAGAVADEVAIWAVASAGTLASADGGDDAQQQQEQQQQQLDSPLERLLARMASVGAAGPRLLDLAGYVAALRAYDSSAAPTPTATAGAPAVRAALAASTNAALADVGRAIGAAAGASADSGDGNDGGGGDDASDALLRLEVLFACLDDAPPPAAPTGDPDASRAAMNAARDALWGALGRFVGGVPAARYGHAAVSALLELQESVTAPGGRWGDWRPPARSAGGGGEAGSAGAHSSGTGAVAGAGDSGVGGAPDVASGPSASGPSGAGLLFARTMGVVARAWPGFQVRAADGVQRSRCRWDWEGATSVCAFACARGAASSHTHAN